METEFKLTQLEMTSSTWARVSTHLEARLQVLREKNDNSQDEQSTARLRGRIEEIKKMLSAGKPDEQY